MAESELVKKLGFRSREYKGNYPVAQMGHFLVDTPLDCDEEDEIRNWLNKNSINFIVHKDNYEAIGGITIPIKKLLFDGKVLCYIELSVARDGRAYQNIVDISIMPKEGDLPLILEDELKKLRYTRH